MSQGRPGYRHRAVFDLAAVGTVVRTAGLALAVATLPLAVGTIAGLLAGAPSTAAGVRAALTAIGGSLSLGTGLSSLAQLSTLGLLAGVWLLGFGLVVDGLVD